MQEGIRRLKELPLSPDLRKRYWLKDEDVQEKANRILLTCVGNRDPFGQLTERPGLPSGKEEGPILTICRELRPKRVYLLHTVHAPNDFTEKANNVIAMLQADDPSCQVEPVKLEAVKDPTDYSQLFPGFRQAIEQILASGNCDSQAIFINTSSGSPQMETTWHLLVERKILPDRRLQVREGRLVPKGESRVRKVVMPLLP